MVEQAIDGRRAGPDAGRAAGPDAATWWREGVVYQVYPRSFADGDGDGTGDLAGIIEHLDYLNDGTPGSLGVDAIWLSPIYPSPGVDVGYDVADYEAIDPRFGTLAEFERLVREAHRRGLRVILDLVMNHSSDQHPWFRESRQSRTNARADWYVWRDPAGRDRLGRPRRPNNWVSYFGGPAWTWEPARGQFYLHTFLAEQPDLNWRNPDVRAAMFAMVEGWLARGVDGFRLDVFNAWLKAADLPSNPRRVLGGRRAYDRQVHRYDKDQPELRAVLGEFRALLDREPGRMSVGELFSGTPELAASYTAERHLVFDFSLIEQPWSARAFARAIERREAAFGPARWPTVVLSNHDQPRHIARFAERVGRDEPGTWDALARAAAVLLLTQRGTPFLYYGEEIALPDVRIPAGEIVDPPARHASWRNPWWNRDQARAPMRWSDGPNGGFSASRPWLPTADDPDGRHDVASQARDPRSVLAFYRRLTWLRRDVPALRRGSLELVVRGDRNVLAYDRVLPGQRVRVAINFGRRAVDAPVAGGGPAGPWRVLLSSGERPAGEREPGPNMRLEPLEAVVLEAAGAR